MLEVVGKRGFKLQSLAADRVIEAKSQRVQGLPLDQNFFLFRRKVFDQIRHLQCGPSFVQTIRDNGMSQVVHMDAQLMSPARLRAKPHE